MKVEGNVTIFAGASGQASMAEKTGKQEREKQGSTIYAGDFQGNMTIRDRIQQKKAQAQKQAMKVVQDAWEGDRAIDDDLNARRERVAGLRQENGAAQDKINEIRKEQEALKDVYGVAEGSGEQQDLELLRRKKDAMQGRGSLSMEELKKCEEIEAGGLTEYQQRQLSLDDQADEKQKIIDENNRQILVENAVIRGTKLERLKYHHMADARKQAEEIEQAAGDEIMGMLIEDAKDHLDEEQEEREEKAEEIREAREEREELIEKNREDKKEQEALAEDMPVGEILDLSKTQEEVRQEVQSIVNKMALVAEDIKGSMVDTNV